MRSLRKLFWIGAAGSLIFAPTTIARGDDISPRLPDVMLVVDTSGAMELSADGATIGDCSVTPSRWALVVQALTGSIPLAAITCSSGAIYSNSVSAGPNPNGAITFATPEVWPMAATGPFDKRDAICFLDGGGNCQNRGSGSNDWDQADDGLLDLFSRKVRFGLMTSDLGRRFENDSTQVSTPWNIDPVNSEGTFAEFSYWYNGSGNWQSGTNAGASQGEYDNAVGGIQDWEVGVRNRNARPWQGRMMGFGPDDLTVDDTALQNERIQRVLLAARPQRVNTTAPIIPALGRPYPGDLPPAAAALADANDFFQNDADFLPTYPWATSGNFLMSAASDAAWTGGCRTADAIFITSGPFGLDMRKTDFDDFDNSWRNPPTCTVPPCPPNPLTAGTPPTSCNAGTGNCPYGSGAVFPMSADAAVQYLSNLQVLLGNTRVHVVAVVKNKSLQFPHGLPPFSCPAWASNSGPFSCRFNCDAITNASDFAAGGACEADPTNIYGYKKESNGLEVEGNIAACCDVAALNMLLPATEERIFVEDISTLKSSVANIVAKSLGGTTSRTQTAYGVSAVTIDRSGSNPTSAGPGGPVEASSYELLSSLRAFFTPPSPNPKFGMWRGFLERRRLACDASTQPTPVPINRAGGDDLGENLQQFPSARKFFTVVAYNGTEPVVNRSLRYFDGTADTFAMGDPATDNLDTVPIDNANLTGLQTAINLAPHIDGMFGTDSYDLLGIQNSDKDKCNDAFGAAGWGGGPIATRKKRCARRTLSWFGGFWNNRPSDRCDPYDLLIGGCAADPSDVNSFPLGAIYHSTPAVVGPPSDFLNDEQYRKFFAVVASAATPDGQATRPTMEYAASIDGQLHAFVISNNSSVAGDTKYPSGSVPNTDGSDLQELWSFIPPVALPNIFPNFNSHAILLDGPLVVSDIIPRRAAADAQGNLATASSGGSWRTILVGSGGNTGLGGYYYALDVTDPRSPKFLWQLSTAGTPGGGNNSPVPLFGASVPGAAIATVGLKNGANVDQVAVAILAGGAPAGAIPTTSIARRCAGGCGGAGVRTTVRDWGVSVPSRSVTIVKLETGEVIKRFEGVIGNAGTPGDLPATDTSLLGGLRSAARPFDSPMTSTPVAFPNTPGVAATRAYVGDADGTMWRINLSSADPANWSTSIAWDSYGDYWATNSGYTGATSQNLVGEPIVTQPVVSLDTAGSPTVTYSTGAQEGFQTFSQEMDTEIVSFRDVPNAAGTGAIVGDIDVVLGGFQRSFFRGQRVTGPLSVFAGTAYFSTFTPASTAGPIAPPCTNGRARVWGLDFLTGAAALDDDNNPVTPALSSVLFNQNEVIFGVQINRVPSCYGASVSTTSDGWLGGNYSAVQSSNPSNYQLVVQTGQNTGTGGFGGIDDLSGDATGSAGALSNSFHVQLTQPKAMVTLRSWASIGE